jgi:hypothetical protein
LLNANSAILHGENKLIFNEMMMRFALHYTNTLSSVMVSVIASSAVYRGFEPRLGQTKDYKIDICCFSAKHEALRRKSKDWMARNHYNVSE